MNGCFWILRSGAHWRDLPERYGKWKTVHRRFCRWRHAGVGERVFEALTTDRDNQYLMIDSTIERAHQQADNVLDQIELVGSGPAVTRVGDLWHLGPHRLLCGDARSTEDVARLCEGKPAALLFTDPPYNVPIDGHVAGLGRIRHREFAQSSGEMDETSFTAFLRGSLAAAASQLMDGAMAYVCMDWRHMREVLDAGHSVFDVLKNLCVWNKTNGGMGSFYRSKHELVFVFKKGAAAHINNFGLGDTGRYRTNVWDCPGISSLGANRDEELAMHPTVKPVALIADAIGDCSKRGDVVIDVSGGSGSTLIAADQCGRVARLIEQWRVHYNTVRPHSALGYRPPAPGSIVPMDQRPTIH